MGLKSDIKKAFLKHLIIKYIDYLDTEDEVYHLIVDKNLELCKEENEKLKEEIRSLKIEKILATEENEIEIELNGEMVKLDKKGVIELALKAQQDSKPKQLPRVRGVISLENISGIAFTTGDMRDFTVHYEDGTKEESENFDFELIKNIFTIFGVTVHSVDEDDHEYIGIKNILGEMIRVTSGTYWSAEYLRKFVLGNHKVK